MPARFFAQRVLVSEVAADLVAETFAEAFAHRSTFDPLRGDPGAWLFGIAKHQLAQYFRTLKVETKARLKLGILERTPTFQDLEQIEELIDFAALGRRIRSALLQLPANQRDAVMLRVVDDLTYEDIASRLGCSQDNARARVSRGLSSLAKVLQLDDLHEQLDLR